MRPNKYIVSIAIVCASFAVPCLNATTIPAGTTLTISTVSLITSQDAVRSSFEAKLAQDVSVKGHVVIESWNKGIWEGQLFSSQSPQVRATFCGTGVRFGERTQCGGENEQRRTARPTANSATGAVRAHCRHNSS